MPRPSSGSLSNLSLRTSPTPCRRFNEWKSCKTTHRMGLHRQSSDEFNWQLSRSRIAGLLLATLTWPGGMVWRFFLLVLPLQARITVLCRCKWISASSWFHSLSCSAPFMSRPSSWICWILQHTEKTFLIWCCFGGGSETNKSRSQTCLLFRKAQFVRQAIESYSVNCFHVPRHFEAATTVGMRTSIHFKESCWQQ